MGVAVSFVHSKSCENADVCMYIYVYICVYITIELACFNLRMKTFGTPDPFIKMKVLPGARQPKLPHHAQQLVTTPVFLGSISPAWREEVSGRGSGSGTGKWVGLWK